MRLWIQIVNFKRYVFGTAFSEKAVFNLTIWIPQSCFRYKKEVLHIICILTTKTSTKNNIFIKKEDSQHAVD